MAPNTSVICESADPWVPCTEIRPTAAFLVLFPRAALKTASISSSGVPRLFKDVCDVIETAGGVGFGRTGELELG